MPTSYVCCVCCVCCEHARVHFKSDGANLHPTPPGLTKLTILDVGGTRLDPGEAVAPTNPRDQTGSLGCYQF